MFHVTGTDTLVLRDDAAGSSVTLVPARGAIVSGFRVGEREILYLDEATLGDPTKNVRGGVPLLFPSPGKLEGDRYSFRGVTGVMKQHGFARNLPWRVAGTSTTTVAAATLELLSNETTRRVFPWDFRLAITFSLAAARLRLDVRVENTGASPMPFGFGIHPYFRVVDKTTARVSTQASRVFDNVTKEVGPFRGFDFTRDEIDLHLLDHGPPTSVLDADGARVTLRASPEHVRWVVWALRGKDFVCVEPWTAPGNALNTGESLLELAPGSARDLWIEVEG